MKGFYGYNPHYGWNTLSSELLGYISKIKVAEAREDISIEAIINDTDHMTQSLYNKIIH